MLTNIHLHNEERLSGMVPDSLFVCAVASQKAGTVNTKDIHNIENSDKQPDRTDRTGVVWLQEGQVYLCCGKMMNVCAYITSKNKLGGVNRKYVI